MKKSSGIMRLLSLREINDAKGKQYRQERNNFLSIEKPQVIIGFNLFQTPRAIAARMVSMAGDLNNKAILEPSIGLGRIIEQIPEEFHSNITAYDINIDCIKHIYKAYTKVNRLKICDFLTIEQGQYDLIIMNPPFKQGQDIKHILHAVKKLRPGGKLISLCFNGVRQNKELKPICDSWEVLPDGSFRESGTNASVVLITIIKG